MNLWDDIIVVIGLVLVFIYLQRALGTKNQTGLKGFLAVVGVFHFMMTLIHYIYEGQFDSFSFYENATIDTKKHFNSLFVSELTGFIAKDYLDLTYFTTCLIFGFFGYLTFIILYVLLSQITVDKNHRYIPLVAVILSCLPSMHYWSSILSKEALIMTLITISLYSVKNFNSRWPLYVLSLGVIAMMRPHVSAILLFAYINAWLVVSKFEWKLKLLILFFGLFTFYFFIDWVMVLFNRPGLSYSSFIAMTNEWEESIRYTPTNDTNVMLQGRSYIYKLLTFTFKPFGQFSSLKLGIASLENLVLVISILSLIRLSFVRWVLQWRIEVIYSILAIVGWFGFMCLVSSNYGYAIRQKSTFLPLLVFVILSFWFAYTPIKRKSISA